MIDQNQTQKTDLASILPTWVDMNQGDDEVEAREPHRRRIMPGQNRVDPVQMENEVEDVVSALRDLPVEPHTHGNAERQKIGVDPPDSRRNPTFCSGC